MQLLTRLAFILILPIGISSFAPYSRHPAGTSAVPGMHNTYLDKTEVTNIAWKEYVWDLKERYGEASSKFSSSLPDKVIWELAYGGDFMTDRNHQEYPIVGVSFEQANEYCAWRSKRVSEKENRDIVYMLPSLKAYKIVTRGKTDNKIAEGLYSTSIGFRTFSGICENAQEMTSERGVAIAGSNRETCLELQEYTEPTASLGFRCMARLN